MRVKREKGYTELRGKCYTPNPNPRSLAGSRRIERVGIAKRRSKSAK